MLLVLDLVYFPQYFLLHLKPQKITEIIFADECRSFQAQRTGLWVEVSLLVAEASRETDVALEDGTTG